MFKEWNKVKWHENNLEYKIGTQKSSRMIEEVKL